MKYNAVFGELLGCADGGQVFSHLMSTLNDSIQAWDYFVNWGKTMLGLPQMNRLISPVSLSPTPPTPREARNYAGTPKAICHESRTITVGCY